MMEDLRRLAEKATPGPWDTDGYASVIGPNGEVIVTAPCYESDGQQLRNDIYIAAANPTAIIALLDELDGLRVRVGELEALLRRGWSLIGTLDIEQIENPEYDYADVVQKWLDNTDSALENKDE